MVPTVVPPHHVACPLCLAAAGQPCVDGRIVRAEPHPLRVRAAEEMARDD